MSRSTASCRSGVTDATSRTARSHASGQDCGRDRRGEPVSSAVPAGRVVWLMVPVQYGLKMDGGTPPGGTVELVDLPGARGVVVVVGGGSGAGAAGSGATGSSGA